jgi:hypothetical protein
MHLPNVISRSSIREMAWAIYESLIPGWPAGDLGVAIGENHIVLREGLTEGQQRKALHWANSVIDGDLPEESEPSSAPLEGSSSDVEPSSGRHVSWELQSYLCE